MAKVVRNYSVKEGESLLSSISKQYNLTYQQICKRLDLNEDYVSQQKSRGYFTGKFINALTREFSPEVMGKKITVAADVETTVKQVRQLKAYVTVLLAHVAKLEAGEREWQKAFDRMEDETRTNLRGLASLE